MTREHGGDSAGHALRAAHLLAATLAGLVWAVPSSEAEAAGSSQARQVVESAGVKAGILLHIGGDAELSVELARCGRFVVFAYGPDRSSAKESRNAILGRGLYGQVSADRGPLKQLPLSDNLANLVVADRLSESIKAGFSLEEVMRVLCPGGVAYLGSAAGLTADALRSFVRRTEVRDFEIVRRGGVWLRIRKPRPPGMDEWTHVQHGPDGNPVSRDARVGPPDALRWLYGPIWRGGRGWHLTGGGSCFYQEGGALAARDAFHGRALWTVRWDARRAAVAADGRLYALTGGDPFLKALDAATGEVVASYRSVRPRGDTLVCVGGELIFADAEGVAAVAAATGRENWRNREAKPVSILRAGDGKVFAQVGGAPMKLMCLDGSTGRKLWERSGPDMRGGLVFYQYGVLVCEASEKGVVTRVYSAQDGRPLWKTDPVPAKGLGVYGLQELIWSVPRYQSIRGFDPATGREKRNWPVKGGHFSYQCSAGVAATSNYIVGARPLVYMDAKTGKITWCRVARNGCGGSPGLMFGNGLTYAFPKACKCFSMLRGYSAFAVDPDLRKAAAAPRSSPLEKGPAYGKAVARGGGSVGNEEERSEWPMFRRDPARSAATDMNVPLPVRVLWQARPEDQKASPWLQKEWGHNPAYTGPLTAPAT